MSIYQIASSQVNHNSMQFRLTNTCLFDQFTLFQWKVATFHWNRKHIIKAILETYTRCKRSITRNNLLDVLWQMLEASDEIDLKPSSRACCLGHDFISMSNAFLVIIFFSNMCFFSNSLNKKKMSGRSKICGKKYRSPCLFKSK